VRQWRALFRQVCPRLTHPPGEVSFETGAGVIRAAFENDRVTVNLTEPKDLQLAQKVFLANGTETVTR